VNLCQRTNRADCKCSTRMYSDMQPVFKCENCPTGAVCSNGNCGLPDQMCGRVKIKGTWYRESEGKFSLLSCPVGHQLVHYPHDVQRCVECGPADFILNSSDPADRCQKCPSSAVSPL
jgi:hypothetical protein